MAHEDAFDISQFTTAPEQMRATIEFSGLPPEEVFGVIGDPKRITDWFMLAKEVRMHGSGDDDSFDVVFTFFGEVYEEFLHFDPPLRYVYKAHGPGFPIKDYVALWEIEPESPTSGQITWALHYSEIEGEEYQRVLPVMLPPIIHESVRRLAPMLGGTSVKLEQRPVE